MSGCKTASERGEVKTEQKNCTFFSRCRERRPNKLKTKQRKWRCVARWTAPDCCRDSFLHEDCYRHYTTISYRELWPESSMLRRQAQGKRLRSTTFLWRKCSRLQRNAYSYLRKFSVENKFVLVQHVDNLTPGVQVHDVCRTFAVTCDVVRSIHRWVMFPSFRFWLFNTSLQRPRWT